MAQNERMKRARKELGLSQEELARQIEAPFVPDWYSEALLPAWETLPDAGT